jgi:hypothetical protein
MEISAVYGLWGAHASRVLVAAFCGNELFSFRNFYQPLVAIEKFVKAECLHQHAESVRSPEVAQGATTFQPMGIVGPVAVPMS